MLQKHRCFCRGSCCTLVQNKRAPRDASLGVQCGSCGDMGVAGGFSIPFVPSHGTDFKSRFPRTTAQLFPYARTKLTNLVALAVFPLSKLRKRALLALLRRAHRHRCSVVPPSVRMVFLWERNPCLMSDYCFMWHVAESCVTRASEHEMRPTGRSTRRRSSSGLLQTHE